MNEMAAGPVRTESRRMESATEVRLVLRVALDDAQFHVTVSKLAPVAIATRSAFAELSTEFGFVATTSTASRESCRRQRLNLIGIVLRNFRADAVESRTQGTGVYLERILDTSAGKTQKITIKSV